MKNYFHLFLIGLFAVIFFLSVPIIAQVDASKSAGDSLISAARELIESTPYCTLITMDSTGRAAARTMDPFLPDENMIIWFGTNKYSRKVKQILHDSRVTVFYERPNNTGYVLIKGNASVVDDSEKKKIYWKDEWKQFYEEERENYTLIKVVPQVLEILDYTQGIIGDSKTWTVPNVEFNLDK